MLIAAPIWLLALIPWAALVIWMLWGRRQRVAVPFIALWRNGDARPAANRAVHAPPVAILLILLAILLAVLAASSPQLASQSAATVQVLVDRGLTMSARDGDSYRYQSAAAKLEPALRGPISIAAIPGHQIATIADVRSLPPTAVDTSADVAQAAKRLLAMTDDAVVVVTDQPLEADPRLVVISPGAMPADVGIAHVAARERPAPQVMVRVTSDAPSSRPAVVISSDGRRVERTIDLTAFVDVPGLGKSIEVALTVGDALAANDRAWLVRESGWPRIEVIATTPPELTRMVATYRKLRPARQGDAKVVSIVDDPNMAAAEAVVLAPTAVAGGGATTLVEHPVTAGVAWAEVLASARIGASAPAGFVPVASVGDHVAVAVRETPRQVWVAVEAPEFPRRADYVLFWTNVFDWLGQGGDAFVAHPVGLLGDGWQRVTDGPAGTEAGLWPGIYERRDGMLRAVNAPVAARPRAVAETDWQQRLARAAPPRVGGRSLVPYLVLAAMLCALGAALRWPARRPAFT